MIGELLASFPHPCCFQSWCFPFTEAPSPITMVMIVCHQVIFWLMGTLSRFSRQGGGCHRTVQLAQGYSAWHFSRDTLCGTERLASGSLAGYLVHRALQTSFPFAATGQMVTHDSAVDSSHPLMLESCMMPDFLLDELSLDRTLPGVPRFVC